MADDMTAITTPRCMFCRKAGILQVTQVQADKLLDPTNQELIQEIMPEAPAEFREQIISGTHPACWEKFMTEDDD